MLIIKQGTFRPRLLNKRRRRKISVEVHKVAGVDGDEFEECVVRLLVPSKENKKAKSSASAKNDDDDDDDDVSTVVPREFMDFMDDGPAFTDNQKGTVWKAKYRIPLKAISIKGTSKKGVWLEISLKASKQVREVIFNTKEVAEQFEHTLRDQLAKEESRKQARMQAALGGSKINTKEQITFLLEVVSARDIPVGDMISSDPYVQVIFNGQEVHKTKYISKT